MSDTAPAPAADPQVLRRGCSGIAPLTARLEPWQIEACSRLDTLDALLDTHGSPVNLIAPEPMGRNAEELSAGARAAGIDLTTYFARKANKALCLVDEAARLGLGVDVASEHELAQVLDRGVDPADIVVTAAVKPPALLALASSCAATLVLDNFDELEALTRMLDGSEATSEAALRFAPDLGESATPSRFGFQPSELREAARRQREAGLACSGLHFHLDGYAADDRRQAIAQALALVDELVGLGERPRFLDIGGGIPMSYLESEAQWERFWLEYRDGLVTGNPLTFEGHGLGLSAHEGEVHGAPSVYPAYQRPVGGEWLEGVLRANPGSAADEGSVAAAIAARGLELRCEPGRYLLDGCGMTIARVAFVKRRSDGIALAGLQMNRTQCRSAADDFLVDPLLLPRRSGSPREPVEAYLVGAYCIERELLTWRRLRFPEGIEAGDIVAFPNTAGYQMHILESASHQIPLARNLVWDGETATLDPIDAS